MNKAKEIKKLAAMALKSIRSATEDFSSGYYADAELQIDRAIRHLKKIISLAEEQEKQEASK